MPGITNLNAIIGTSRVNMAKAGDKANLAIIRAWNESAKTLEKEIAGLEQVLIDHPNSATAIYKTARLKSLLRQVNHEIENYSTNIAAINERYQLFGARTGADTGADLVGAHVGGSFSRLNTRAVDSLVAALQADSPIDAALATFGPDASQLIKDEIRNGVVTGRHPSETLRLVRDGLSQQMIAKAATIIRTESWRAYREGNRSVYQQNSDVIDTWIWYSHQSASTCAVCWAMHGTEHPLNEPMGTHPNCRCTLVPKTKSWLDLGFDGIAETTPKIPSGEEVFARLPEDQQRKILGPGMHTLYQRGTIKLEDMTSASYHPVFGKVQVRNSIAKAKAQAEQRAVIENIHIQAQQEAERQRAVLAHKDQLRAQLDARYAEIESRYKAGQITQDEKDRQYNLTRKLKKDISDGKITELTDEHFAQEAEIVTSTKKLSKKEIEERIAHANTLEPAPSSTADFPDDYDQLIAKDWRKYRLDSEHYTHSIVATLDERAGAKAYQLSDYKDMNKILRDGYGGTAAQRKNVAAFRDLTLKAEIQDDVVLTRYIQGGEGSTARRIAAEMKPGDTFMDRGFISTSMKSDVGYGFDTLESGNTDLVQFHISARKGQRGLDIGSFNQATRYEGEYEVVLPPGTTFQLVKKVPDVHVPGKTHFFVEIVNQPKITGVIDEVAPAMREVARSADMTPPEFRRVRDEWERAINGVDAAWRDNRISKAERDALAKQFQREVPKIKRTKRYTPEQQAILEQMKAWS